MERMKCKFPVLRESRLYQLMEEAQLSTKMDRLEVQQAIKFLHECGVLLHYNDLQTKLSELYFLDPEWLCALMAQIITLKQISFINEKGVSKIQRIFIFWNFFCHTTIAIIFQVTIITVY